MCDTGNMGNAAVVPRDALSETFYLSGYDYDLPVLGDIIHDADDYILA